MSRIAYVNGRYLPQRHATVNVEDRGYQFADGVYEVVYVRHGRFVDARLHLARLERSLGEVRITMPMGRAALELVLHQVVRLNRVRDGLLYMQVTRGVARREHAFPAGTVAPGLVVTARRLPPAPDAPDRWAVQAITMPDLRWARCDIKTTGLLPNVLARQAAREQGAYEAILVGGDGLVTEGAATNVWIVDAQGTLRTRPLGHAILPGCTRAALMAEMREHAVPFAEGAFSDADLRAAREVFLTSATSLVKPVTAIDGQLVGTGGVGPVTQQLFALFTRHMQGGLHNAA